MPRYISKALRFLLNSLAQLLLRAGTMLSTCESPRGFHFFDLPLEIRHLVYSHVVDDLEIQKKHLDLPFLVRGALVSTTQVGPCLVNKQFKREYEEELRLRGNVLKLRLGGCLISSFTPVPNLSVRSGAMRKLHYVPRLDLSATACSHGMYWSVLADIHTIVISSH